MISLRRGHIPLVCTVRTDALTMRYSRTLLGQQKGLALVRITRYALYCTVLHCNRVGAKRWRHRFPVPHACIRGCWESLFDWGVATRPVAVKTGETVTFEVCTSRKLLV